MDFVVARTFNSLYIALDIAWLLIYAGILLYFKKQTAITVGLIMGVAYFLVDYGIFYKHLHTRQIEGTDPLIETNLGLPYIYYIHRYFTAR